MSFPGPDREGSRAPAGTTAPNGPGWQPLIRSLLTSSSLKVEYVFTCWVVNGRDSDRQEHRMLGGNSTLLATV